MVRGLVRSMRGLWPVRLRVEYVKSEGIVAGLGRECIYMGGGGSRYAVGVHVTLWGGRRGSGCSDGCCLVWPMFIRSSVQGGGGRVVGTAGGGGGGGLGGFVGRWDLGCEGGCGWSGAGVLGALKVCEWDNRLRSLLGSVLGGGGAFVRKV